jgi:maleate isomerase
VASVTIVQPDFDDIRPVGVTNHYSRIFTPNSNALSNDTFGSTRSAATPGSHQELSFFGGAKGADTFATRIGQKSDPQA